MKLTNEELERVSCHVKHDSAKTVIIQNYTMPRCGMYCAGNCAVSSGGRNIDRRANHG